MPTPLLDRLFAYALAGVSVLFLAGSISMALHIQLEVKKRADHREHRDRLAKESAEKWRTITRR